jgi:hypothetical protein
MGRYDTKPLNMQRQAGEQTTHISGRQLLSLQVGIRLLLAQNSIDNNEETRASTARTLQLAHKASYGSYLSCCVLAVSSIVMCAPLPRHPSCTHRQFLVGTASIEAKQKQGTSAERLQRTANMQFEAGSGLPLGRVLSAVETVQYKT